MSYQDELKQHLVTYKRDVLDIQEPGIYRHKGRDLPYEHLLPKALADHNLLEPALSIERTYRLTHKKLSRHRDFHHLNSSQAFAFNLFFPYFEGGPQASAALLRALGQAGEMLANWEPEAIPDADEETNLDSTWLTESDMRTFCEVKLSEAKVGTAADDKKHSDKLRDTYFAPLAPYCSGELLEQLKFFELYQFARNVWHLARCEAEGRLIFLLPRANIGLWKQIEGALSLVNSPLRQKISMVAIEDLLSRLATDTDVPAELRTYPAKLIEKYIPAASRGPRGD